MSQTRAENAQAAPRLGFDEQLWPINLAIVVLAGFVAGSVIALSSFDDPRWLYNGWVRMATLAASVGLLMLGVNFIQSRRLRRNLQLAIVLSCLVHVILLIVLYNQHTVAVARDALAGNATTDPARSEQEVVIPEFINQDPDQLAEDFDKPIEITVPEKALPTPIQREATQTPDVVPESQPTPLPSPTPDVQARAVELPAMEQAAPHKGEQPSLLSRRMTDIDLHPSDAIPSPETDAKDPGPGAMEPKATALARQSNESAASAAIDAPAPLPAPPQQTVQLARRDVPEPETNLQSSVSSLPRRVNRPATVPRSNAESPEIAGGLERPVSVQPQVVISRRAVDGPQAFMQQSPELKSAAAADVGRLDVARADRSDQPQIASAPLKALGRTTDQAALPAAVAADALQAAAGASDTPGNSAPGEGAPVGVAAAAVAVTRGQTDTTPDIGGGGAIGEGAPGQAAGGAGPAAAGLELARAETSQTPSLNPQAGPGGTIARATIPAAVEASPVRVDSPAAGESAGGSDAQAAPARMSLSKGSGGGIGGGLEQNLGSGVSDTAGPAAVAAISASRPDNLQRGPEGPAIAPSAPALGGRSVAGAGPASATIAASADSATAEAFGGSGTGSIDASGSAAVQKADGRGQPGLVSAGAGTGTVDIGPTQVVASAGSGRKVGGGGGPIGRLDTRGTQVVRSGAGGAPLAALAAPAVAALPEAPAGTGGGGPAGQGGGGGAGGGTLDGGLATSVGRAAGGAELPAGLAPGGGPIVQNPAGGGGTGQIAAGPVVRAGSGGNESVPGIAPSGSSKFPSRSLGQSFVADTRASGPQLPAGSTEAETPGTSPGQVGGSPTPVRTVAGLPGGSVRGPVGAAEGSIAVDSPIVGTPGLGIGRPAPPAAGEQVPVVGNLATAGPLQRTNVAGVAGGQGLVGASAAAIDAPATEGTAGGQPQAQPTGPAAVGSPGRGSGALPVQVAALDGPGGLGAAIAPAPQVGSLSNRAQRDSEIVHTGKDRFLSRTVGGALKVDGKAREPARAFSGRGGQRLTKEGLPTDQFTERTEDSVERGLDFLARHQSADGHWSFNDFGAGKPGYEQEEAAFHSDAAATGLALLAFLGAGYDHYDDQYQNAVRGGLEFLVRNQKPDGDLYLPADAETNKSAWFYSHGIASIALCEAYGMTGDEKLKEAAQRAIDFIVASQHPTRGGWRYAPQFDADTSVSGWQLMALKSGELAGLKIPAGTYEKVRHWLDSAQAASSDPSHYVYNPNAPNTIKQRHGRRPTTTMTAVGLLMRLYTGWNRNDPRMAAGAKQLMDHLPAFGTPSNPERDTYYWYYATQVMFHMKGDYWKSWNDRLRPMLLEKQIASGPLAGSWDPLGAVPDKWGPHAGRIYVTALNLLSLEVNYRHLPIYESEAK